MMRTGEAASCPPCVAYPHGADGRGVPLHMELTAGAVPPPALRGSTPTLQAHPVSSLKAAPSTATSTYARSALFSALVMSAGAAIPTCLRRPPAAVPGPLRASALSNAYGAHRVPEARSNIRGSGIRPAGARCFRVERAATSFRSSGPCASLSRNGIRRSVTSGLGKRGGTFLAYGRQGRG